MNELLQKAPKIPTSVHSMVKLFIIGFIILVLLIPVFWIRTVISERNLRKTSVQNEIASKWGTAQYLIGPFISVPYHKIVTSKDSSGNETQKLQKEYLQISPETMEATGKIQADKHHRGIFSVIGYKADLEILATVPTMIDPKVIPAHIKLEWNDAIITFGLADQHGLRKLDGTVNGLPLKFENNENTFSVITVDTSIKSQWKPNWNEDNIDKNVNTKLSFAAKTPLMVKTGKEKIKLHIIFTGTEKISFLTSALQESVHLIGDWNSPSFIGNMLPESKTVNNKGFDSIWRSNYLSSGNKTFWTSENQNQNFSHLGVMFLIPVDSYQQTTRTLKYSILFLLLTFMTFFFAETVTKQRIHPVQYIMVGCSLVLFYLLLLSISEHIAFGWSYLIAAAAVVLQVSLYCASILKTGKFAFRIGSLLSGLYLYLYVLLRLEDNALLIGSISLFVLLGIAMYAIRNVNWYGQE